MPDIFDLSKKKDIHSSAHQPSVHASRTLKEEVIPHKIKATSLLSENLTDFFFSMQEPHEKILLALRSHVITNIPWIFISVILILLPIIIKFFLPGFSLIDSQSLSKFIPIGIGFYYLLIATYAFVNYLNWFYNIAFVTQKRVIIISFLDLIYHDVTITELDTVGDVQFMQSGLLQSLLNYGNISFQTTLTGEPIKIKRIEHPKEIVYFIENLIGKELTHA